MKRRARDQIESKYCTVPNVYFRVKNMVVEHLRVEDVAPWGFLAGRVQGDIRPLSLPRTLFR